MNDLMEYQLKKVKEAAKALEEALTDCEHQVSVYVSKRGDLGDPNPRVTVVAEVRILGFDR